MRLFYGYKKFIYPNYEEMLNKLHVVADYEGRSANSEILILIRNAIEKYEKEHGEIK